MPFIHREHLHAGLPQYTHGHVHVALTCTYIADKHHAILYKG